MKLFLYIVLVLLAACGLLADVTKRIAQGEAFTLSVEITGGTPPYQYQWRKDGVAIPGATAATYKVAVAAASDAGTYDVKVTNEAGSVVSDKAVPVIITLPVVRQRAIESGPPTSPGGAR